MIHKEITASERVGNMFILLCVIQYIWAIYGQLLVIITAVMIQTHFRWVLCAERIQEDTRRGGSNSCHTFVVHSNY